MTTLPSRRLLASVIGVFALSLSLSARAELLTDLQSLNAQARSLQAELSSVTLSVEPICGALAQANQQARALANTATAIDESLAAPLQVDAAVFSALDELSATGVALANEALRLSVDLGALQPVLEAFTLREGLIAMLQLSDDIGTMADRIGEMADRILLMADDIGVMADRIIQTQELQNANVALTLESILQTQTNALALVSVMEDASYSLTIASLLASGHQLEEKMLATTFTPLNMASRLSSITADVGSLKLQVADLAARIRADARGSTMALSPAAMMELTELSAMAAGLGTAVDGYVVAIGGLQAITSTPTLRSSMKSMLTLSADIGLMANRILEMADQILAMADNIGLQADQIVATQAAANMNIEAAQASVLAAQTMAVGIIATRQL